MAYIWAVKHTCILSSHSRLSHFVFKLRSSLGVYDHFTSTGRVLFAWAQTSFYSKWVNVETLSETTICRNCQHQLKKKNWGHHKDTPSWGNIRFFWSFCPKRHGEQMLDTLPHTAGRKLSDYRAASLAPSNDTVERGHMASVSSVCHSFHLCL